MRIDRLSLAGFGRFSGATFDLGPGLNVIYGENEAGKSTLQRFILAMLYGMQKAGKRRAFTEDAARYRPWHGGEYRGSLIYTLGESGRSFRVEREFEPGRERVAIYDGRSGADLSGLFPQDRRKERLFAEEHLGLSEEAFRSTAWIGQMEVGRLEQGQELVARVANLQDAGREDLSVGSALRTLEERMREIGTDRAPTRPYARLGRRIEEKRLELERAEAVREQTLTWESQLTEVRAVLAEMEEELAELYRRIDWARLHEAEERLERLTAAGKGAREARRRADELSRYAAFPVHLRERLVRLKLEIETLPTLSPARAGGWEWLAAAILLTVPIAFVPPFMRLPAGLLAAGALAVFAYRRLQARHHAETQGRHLEQLRRLQGQVSELLAGAGVASAEAFDESCARHEAWRRAAAEAESMESALRSLQGGETAEGLAAAVQRMRAELVGPEPSEPGDSVRLQNEARRLEARRVDLNARASDLAARVETALGDLPDTADLRRELEALREERQALDEELGALELAHRTITEVSAEIHREFAPRLNAALGEAVAAVTGGKYRTVRIDEEAAIRVITEGERTVDLLALSGGTVDQFYFGLRIALLDLLVPGHERCPLILDDPFVQYDDSRLRWVMEYLGELSRDRQIILMTCHQREAVLARSLGVPVTCMTISDGGA